MKVYCYYIYGQNILVDEYPGVKADTIKRDSNGYEYSLYAYTNKKEFAKFFKETRNMDIFFEKIFEVSKEDFESFCDSNQAYLLEEHIFTIRGIENDRFIEKPYKMVCTTMEYDSVCYSEHNIFDDMLYNLIGNIGEFIDMVELFIPDLQQALRILHYESFKNYYVPTDIYDQDLEYDNDLMLDQFKLYISLFTNTFKE